MNSSVINYQLPVPPAPRGKVRLHCEVTPGKVEEVEIPAEMLERYVAGKIVPVPGKVGIYKAQLRCHRPLEPLTEELCAMWGMERRQILALGIAGLINLYRGTTGATQVDPESVWDHIYGTRMSTDGDGRSLAQQFWTAENVRHYSDAQDFVRAAGIVSHERRAKAGAVPHLEFDFGQEEPAA